MGPQLHLGLSLGATQIGGSGYFSIGPLIGLLLGASPGPVLSFQNALMLLPVGNDVGFRDEATVGAGYRGSHVIVAAGAMLAAYRLPICGDRLCGVVVGLAPGAFAEVDVFLRRFVGMSARGTVAWSGGQSLVPSDEVAWSLVTGPVVRWE